MPARSQHWMVTGRVATEDDVPNAVMSAWGSTRGLAHGGAPAWKFGRDT